MQFLNAKNIYLVLKTITKRTCEKETSVIKKALKCPKSKSNRGKDETKNTQIYIWDRACSIV